MTEIHTFNGKQVLLEVVPKHKQNIILKNFSDEGTHRSWLDHVIRLPNEISAKDCIIIGTIQHPGVFSFDPEPFVEKCLIDTDPMPFSERTTYKDYSNGFYTLNKFDSFLSRLASWGYYWDNPCGKMPPFQESLKYVTESQMKTYEKELRAWQEAESRKLSVEQMVVVIQIKKI